MITAELATGADSAIGETTEGPWLVGPDEVDGLDRGAEVVEGGGVGVGGAEGEIVAEGEAPRCI